MSAQHTPGRMCDECEGWCLRKATVDEANTALAVATTLDERIFAAACLAEAAAAMAENLFRVRTERRAQSAVAAS